MGEWGITVIMALYFYPDGTGTSFTFSWPALHEWERAHFPDIEWEEDV